MVTRNLSIIVTQTEAESSARGFVTRLCVSQWHRSCLYVTSISLHEDQQTSGRPSQLVRKNRLLFRRKRWRHRTAAQDYSSRQVGIGIVPISVGLGRDGQGMQLGNCVGRQIGTCRYFARPQSGLRRSVLQPILRQKHSPSYSQLVRNSQLTSRVAMVNGQLLRCCDVNAVYVDTKQL